jgi:NADH-quinone oxidoreductase subunit G
MRVLPRLNDDVNEEWLADKSRHAVDGLRYQRLDRPYVRKAGKLVEATWDEAFAAIAAKLKASTARRSPPSPATMCDAESMVALKDLMAALGSPNIDCRQDGAKLEAGARGGYIFNPGVRGIDQADAILLVGTNPRWESPVLNARIRKRYLSGSARSRASARRSISPIRSSGSARPGDACATWPTASWPSPRSGRRPRTR